MSNLDSLTFLLVENDLEILDRLSAMLQEAGQPYVLMAEDGSEAWSMFRNFNVDFIISGLDIPEVGGLALLRIVRSKQEFSATPFILMVRQATPKMVFQAGRAGVTDLLIWPMKPEMFKDRVLKALGQRLDPKNQEVERIFQQGLDRMKEGRFEEALHDFEQVLAVEEHAEVYFNLGYIQAAKGRYESALPYFQKATQINNHYAMAYQQLAEVYTKLGNQAEAERYYHQAGEIYLERKQDGEAEEVFKILTELRPDTTNVYNSLGIIYRRSGRPGDAVTQYLKALKVDPDNENIYFNLSRVYLDMKNLAAAKDAVANALRIQPGFAPAKELAKALELGLTFNL